MLNLGLNQLILQTFLINMKIIYFLGGWGEDKVTVRGLSLFQLTVLGRQINNYGALVG
jgi:hypothetical protein